MLSVKLDRFRRVLAWQTAVYVLLEPIKQGLDPSKIANPVQAGMKDIDVVLVHQMFLVPSAQIAVCRGQHEMDTVTVQAMV